MRNHISVDPPTAQHPTSSVLSLVAGLVRSLPNEEFGVLARWMSEEANRRGNDVLSRLHVGAPVVWVNTTGKLTRGVVVELGSKNAKVRSQHGGELHMPLARLAAAEQAAERLSPPPPRHDSGVRAFFEGVAPTRAANS